MAAIHTPRLTLALASPEQAGALADYYERNRDFLRPFEARHGPEFFTEAGQRELLELQAAEAEEDRSYRFYLSPAGDPGRIVGMAGLCEIVRGAFQSCFVSYKLDAALLNRGYMTEAVRALAQYAFGPLGLHRLEANIMPRNAPSLRVAEKAGFVSEGLARKYLKIDGVWEDHIHMVRLADDE